MGSISSNAIGLVRKFTKTKEYEFTLVCPHPKTTKWENEHEADIKFIYDTFHTANEPGLVSEFKVAPEFFVNRILDGSIDEEGYKEACEEKRKERNLRPGVKVENLHSMVMIGAYHATEKGKYWFLLQNTHREGYFKILSGEYLASCEVKIHFLSPKSDVSLKDNYVQLMVNTSRRHTTWKSAKIGVVLKIDQIESEISKKKREICNSFAWYGFSLPSIFVRCHRSKSIFSFFFKQ